MSPPKKPPSELVVSLHLQVAPEQRAAVEALAQPGESLSNVGRRVIAAGLAALENGHDPELLEVFASLERLSAISGRRTPAGAYWCPTPETLPDPQILRSGDVIATRSGLVVVGPNSTLTLDIETTAAVVVEGDGSEVGAPLPLEALLEASALAQSALIGLARGGGDRRAMGTSGLVLERRADGQVRIALGGAGVVVPIGAAWVWAAELASLAARALQQSCELRAALDRRLEVVP